MKKSVVSLIAFIGLPSAVGATDWAYVAGEWTKYYYDPSSLEIVDSSERRVRVLIDDVPASAYTFGPSVSVIATYDCLLPAVLYESETWYSGSLGTGDIMHHTDELEKNGWQEILDSDELALRNSLCEN